MGGYKQRAKYAAFLSEDPENLGISVREESESFEDEYDLGCLYQSATSYTLLCVCHARPGVWFPRCPVEVFKKQTTVVQFVANSWNPNELSFVKRCVLQRHTCESTAASRPVSQTAAVFGQ